MDKNVFKNNRKKLLERIEDNSIVILYSGVAPHKTADQFYKYTPSRNFFYVTGINKQNMKLIMVKSGDINYEYLFIEETSDFIEKWIGKRLTKQEVSKISGIDLKNVLYLKDFENMFSRLMTLGRTMMKLPPNNLYLDLQRYNPNMKPLSVTNSHFIIDNYPELNIVNLESHFSYMRMYKSNEEISKLREAIEYTNTALNSVMKNLKSSKNERELEALFEYEIRCAGSEGVSFNTIAANGMNATVLHYEENSCDLTDGNLILFDLGALSNNYGSDITRTYPINGKYTDRQKEIYEIVLEVNKKCIEYVKPGILMKDLNDYAKKLLTEKAKNIGLIKEDHEINNYYYHGVSHYLGLDVHDVGLYTTPLKEGVVLTIEPGLYIANEGIGIRIEDDVLVTKDGSLNLSNEIIKEIDDIEEFMKKS